ncbi:fungal-specific transcription factor domain-domain-containing protein [Microdochium bolleyi]|uniref:Fungal-specific transcription factor domain-domain-containing protein n=1 Tax=Microdochium bolleyi TaxID=196109 RepID=A0A136IU50_9PEZI|nr:fungal-specific transcription factor domain-domain-containing protein [Microdochium bolleyi]
MAEATLEWMPFGDTRRPKRKRAELVCVSCHAKKVKCDLQPRTKCGFSDCTACEAAAKECTVRTSRRGRWPRDSGSGSRENTAGSREAPEPPPPAHDALAAAPDPSMLARRGQASLRHPPSLQPRAITTETPQSQHSQASTSQSEARYSHAGDVDTGFLHVYRVENQSDAQLQQLEACLGQQRHAAQPCPIDEELQQSFSETYWENCYAWCPVLDRETLFDDVARSPLLAYALALASSHIQPPLVPHEGPATYYKKAKEILYGDDETDKLAELRAIALFYWWAPRAPTIAHRNSSWWWTSVIIRQAQQMNLHRELRPDHPIQDQNHLSLRRRIWWTAFARERLTALCQSKPCIIDPADCNISEPTLADFPNDPSSQRKGSVFIHWVKLCAIIGDVAKTLSRTPDSSTPRPFPHNLRQRLIHWVRSLPEDLHLPISSARTVSFDRDVHQLYLPYLTTIIVLHLKRSAHALPQALPPAILAASCIARILKDTLSRGNTRFLMAISSWYAGTAFTALLQACRIPHLSRDANECLDVLVRAVEQFQQMWGTANVIRQGFTRLREQSEAYNKPFESHQPSSLGLASSNAGDIDYEWTELFPFVTRATGGIADSLLGDREQGIPTRGFPSPENLLFHDTMMTQYQDLLEPFTDYFLSLPDMGLQG